MTLLFLVGLESKGLKYNKFFTINVLLGPISHVIDSRRVSSYLLEMCYSLVIYLFMINILLSIVVFVIILDINTERWIVLSS